MNFKIDSIIFDLDGTLWNTTEIELKSINEIIEKKYNIPTITLLQLEKVMGFTLDDAADTLFGKINKEIGIEILNISAATMIEHLKKSKIKPYETVIETLEILNKKYKLYIVSNCEDGYIETFIETQGLKGIFKDYECSGRTGMTKGNNIKLIKDRNNLISPIYVGDTKKDFEAAKFADIPFIYAKYGFGKLDNYDISIEKFKDLLEIIS